MKGDRVCLLNNPIIVVYQDSSQCVQEEDVVTHVKVTEETAEGTVSQTDVFLKSTRTPLPTDKARKPRVSVNQLTLVRLWLATVTYQRL